MADWWLSSRAMTVIVTADDEDRITEAPAIVREFVGQTVQQLERWMERQGGLSVYGPL